MSTFSTGIQPFDVSGNWNTSIVFEKTQIDGNIYSGSTYFTTQTSSGWPWRDRANVRWRMLFTFYDINNNVISTTTPSGLGWNCIYNAGYNQQSNWANGTMYDWDTVGGLPSSSQVNTLCGLGYSSLYDKLREFGWSTYNGNWYFATTSEPWGIRYSSDTGAQVYSPRSKWSSATNYRSYRGYGRSTSPVPKNFTFTIPDGATYFKVTLSFKFAAGGIDYNGGSYTFPSGSGKPSDTIFHLETNSKLWIKETSSWEKKARIYKLESANNWKKHNLFKKDSSGWTQIY